MRKTPIIIDCDPGHDDAIAILMAAACDKLDVKGITIVGGNQTLEKCLNNTLKLLSHLDLHIPVAAGAKGPLLRGLTVAPYAHGDSGMDGPQLPPATQKPVDMNAIQLMEKIVRESEEKVTLCPMGPLTNIAIFLRANPDLVDRIDKISLMGGTTLIGNRTPTSEFNIWEDPEAADIVFRSGIPLYMQGLDVTYQAGVNDEEIAQIRAIGNKYAVFVADLLDFFSKYHRNLGRLYTPLHDPCAVAYVIDPDMFTTQDHYVEIDMDGELTLGTTVTHNFGRCEHEPNCTVSLGIDRDKFVKLLFDSLEILGKGGRYA